MGIRCGAAVIVALSVVSLSSASGQITPQPVALSGEAAPGTAASFRTFANPIMNGSGDVAFQANLTGPTTDVVPHGVWAGVPGALRTLAVAGQPAPGIGGARFRTPGWPIVLTSDGASLFYGQLVEENGITFDNGYGIWTGMPGDMRLYSRRGDPAPGLPPGVNYDLFFANPHYSGRLGFSASLQGPAVDGSNYSAAWVGSIESPDSLRLIARGGDPAPGLPPGSRFLNLATPSVNASGAVLLQATATSALPGAPVVVGIWAGPPDNLRPVVTSVTPAPDAPGRTMSSFGVARLNDAGRIAFMGFLNADSDEQRLSDVGIWAGAGVPGGVRGIALEGRQAPGFEDGVVFRASAPGDFITYDAFKNPSLGNGGHVAFAATVFGGSTDFFHNDGVWVSGPVGGPKPPALTSVAREGDHPPGTPDGTLFAGILSGDDLIAAFESPLINASGQVAFEALTSGPLGQFGRGIWATDPAGVLHLVAHTGAEFEVAPGDVRQVELIKLNAGGSSADGQLSAFNDAGQLAFGLRFTDGSEGVFVATVPEPAAIVWLLPAVALLVRIRRATLKPLGDPNH